MKRATVLDLHGNQLSPCSEDKARKLLWASKAELVSENPLVIQLPYAVDVPAARSKEETETVEGQSILVHVCCGPCVTYTVKRLRQCGWQVTGHWYNPNLHPYGEHEKRRESLARFAERVELPMVWESGYEMPAFLRAVVGHERFRERCLICYRMRLERTARVAAQLERDAFTTTLLISPYQDQAAIRRFGEEMGKIHGVRFYYENFRRGFAEHHRLAREHGLYMQRYCGCIYSEWEARDRQAWTRPRDA